MITRKMATGSGHVKVGDRESQTQKQRHLHQLIDVRKTVYFFTFTVFLSPLIYYSASRITVLPLPQLSNIFAFQPLLIAAKDNTDKVSNFFIYIIISCICKRVYTYIRRIQREKWGACAH